MVLSSSAKLSSPECDNGTKYKDSWGIAALSWPDVDNLGSLHLSAIGGHSLTMKTLLEAGSWKGANAHKAPVEGFDDQSWQGAPTSRQRPTSPLSSSLSIEAGVATEGMTSATKVIGGSPRV